MAILLIASKAHREEHSPSAFLISKSHYSRVVSEPKEQDGETF
jgi:hypothetical protein